ncbi:MAG: nucleotidyltransferase domain-containing protein [Deltaproteobacteria bacterium]|nr:nucleotidyltransferase domain-containing protein [Deltaproteobacteria bacterium]
MTEADRICKTLKSALGKRSEIKFAYLFGSLAKGTAGRTSDIDVAVYVDDKALKMEQGYGYKAELTTALMSALGTNKVDVVVLNVAKPFLRHQVMKNGKVILSNDAREAADFIVDTMRRYDDAKRLMAIQHHYMLRRIEEGRFGR